ncbi:MAG: beta strand repeat-containing protein [Bacteroidales bacterium]
MKKILFFLILLLGISYLTVGQSLLVDDFTGLTVGANLAGQSSWTKFGSGPDATIGNATALSAANYNGGGGEYVIMPSPSGTTSKVSKPLGSTPAPGTNTFYISLLVNISSTSVTSGNYFLTLGDPLAGTTYFPRLFAQSNGAGYSLGISKLSNTATYGATVLSYNQTYVVVIRYDFVTGTANDVAYLWVNPTLSAEPATASAEVTISAGSDALPATVGNVHWHNRGTANPVGTFDGLRVAYGATSPAAWTSLNAYAGAATATITIAPPTTLTGFTYTVGAGPSAEQSFIISGSNLSANISIVPSTNYEISTGTGALFSPTNPIVLNQAGGIVTATVIHVRLKSNLPANNYNGEIITASSTGAANATVTCSGSVTAVVPPSISVTPATLTGFATLFGNASASQSYTVSGDNLLAPVTLTAPATYEISSDNISFYGTFDLAQSGGNITGEPVTIYARILSTAPAGAAAGDITHASTGATTVNVNASGYVSYPEPSNHAANFAAVSPSNSSITTTWSDNDGTQIATGFMIMANTTGVFTPPADGVQPPSDSNLSDGTGLVFVNHAIQTFTWTGLPSSTHYYFVIYAYTNTLTNINYKTVPSAPAADVLTQPFIPPLAAWTFDATAAKPNTPLFVAANFGDQTSTAMLYADGTNGSSLFLCATTDTELDAFSGTTLNDPREGANVLSGNSYCPAGGATNSANGKSMVIKFSMTALQDPILSFATRGTSTGFNTHTWAWSTDGTNFTPFGTNTAVITTTFLSKTLNMSTINALDGAPVVYLRITFSGATSTTGNNRLDNIVIRASAASTLTPTVVTNAATAVGATTATLNGTVNANNQSTAVTFDYGTAPGTYTFSAAGVPATVTGSTTTAITADLTGLGQNTVYYYSIKGVNGSGTSNGSELFFQTGCLPAADAGQISGPATVHTDGTPYIYTVPVIANAATYIWSFPSPFTITAGESTNTVTVTFGNGAITGVASVFGVNACDEAGNPSEYAITVAPNVPATLDVTGTVANGQTTCYNATQTITVAGNSTTFEVQSGGSATMIAGQNIILLPGATILSGGYFRGYIAPAGPFCSVAKSTGAGNEETGLTMMDNKFKIYPNPTSGVFTIEQVGDPNANVKVDILGTLGAKILSADLQGMHKAELSIQGNPPGIYFVKLTAGEKVQTVKIILTK